jgi:hypothetical protein
MPMLHVYVSMLQNKNESENGHSKKTKRDVMSTCREMDKQTVATDILAMLLMDPFRIGPKKQSWKKIVPGPRRQPIIFGGLEAVAGGMFVTSCGRVFLPVPCGCRTKWIHLHKVERQEVERQKVE